jgi:flagellar motor switch protein FliM
MPTLERFQERLAGGLRDYLQETLRREVSVGHGPGETERFGDLVAGWPTPTYLEVRQVRAWRAPALVAVDAGLVFLLVEHLFGGRGRGLPAGRRTDFSPAERRFAGELVEFYCRAVKSVWQPVADLELEPVKTEINPHFASVATQTESVLVCPLEVELEGGGGRLALVMPAAQLETVRERLQQGIRNDSPEVAARWSAALRRHLAATEVELRGVFLQTHTTLREVLAMHPGDVLPIEMPKTAELYAGDRRLLRGKFGLSRGYNALRITEPVSVPDSMKETTR